jgi:hypothetical protein
MNSVCYAKKKNSEICNTNLTEKNRHEIKIEDKIYYVCGRHKRINNIEDIDTSMYTINNKNNKDDIIEEFNEKINIINDKKQEEDNNKKIKTDRKKPCLQYIIYLISKDNNDMCQFDDCQFAHNIDIIYT